MKKQWIMRPAVAEDAEGLAQCMKAAYAIYQERMEGERLPPMDVDYREEIQNYPTWVVEFDGAVVGGLIMVFEEQRASLANIAVSPDFQGHGMGGAIMKAASAFAKEKGYSRLHLATHVNLTENVSLYRHLGWLETKRDNTRVHMEKDIGK